MGSINPCLYELMSFNSLHARLVTN